MWELDEFNRRVLLIMLLEVGEELFAITGMDGGRNAIGTFGEPREYAVVNKVVNQNDSTFGAANEVGDVGPCVPHAAGGENGFGKLLGRDFVNPIKNKIYLFVGFLLVMLDVGNTFYHLETLIDDMRYGCEGSHDTDVDANSCF